MADESGATADESAPQLAPTMTTMQRLRAIVGGSAGNLVEWYDWFAYTSFSLYFAQSFFPKGDEELALLQAAVTNMISFGARPVGAWLMGNFADRAGRKTALIVAVLMMCFGALMMAMAPTYEQLGSNGYLAAWIVAAARLLQGLSVGGQYGAAATYMSEVAPKGRRGFWSSFQYVTLIGGQLLAGIVLMVLLLFYTEEEMKAGAWRIAFWIGASLAVVVFFLQTFIHESHSFKAIKEKSRMDPRHGMLVVGALGLTLASFVMSITGHPIPGLFGGAAPEKGFELLMFKHGVTIGLLLLSAAVLVFPMAKKYPKPTFAIMGLTIGGTSSFYAYSTYMLKFLQATHGDMPAHFTKQIANNINLWYLSIFMVAQPIMGLLSDKFGRKTMLLLAFGGGTLAAVPVYSAIATNGSFWTAIALCAAPLLILSAYTSISAIVKAELFPAAVRALGVALPYAIANAAAGALVEPLALYWKTQHHESNFYWYVAAVNVVGFAAAFFLLHETTKKSEILED